MGHDQQYIPGGRGGYGHRLRNQQLPHPVAPVYGGNIGVSMAGTTHPQQRQPPMNLAQHPYPPIPRPNMPQYGPGLLPQVPNQNTIVGNMGMQVQDFVKYGDTFYKIWQILLPQNNNPNRMSNGVRVLRNTVTETEVIEKNIMTIYESQHTRAQTEIKCLKQIRDAGGSPNLNAIYEAFWMYNNTKCILLLEYCDRYTLEDHITESLKIPHAKIAESLCWHVLSGMTAALTMLHYGIRNPDSGTRYQPTRWNTICHLDIKPANVFMSRRMLPAQETYESRVVLGDFGCAVTKEDMENGEHDPDILSAATRGWTPPEIRVNAAGRWEGPYGKPMDIWAMGGVIQSLCRLIYEPHQESADSRRPCGGAYTDELNKGITSSMTREMLVRPTAVDMWGEIKKLKAKLAST